MKPKFTLSGKLVFLLSSGSCELAILGENIKGTTLVELY